MPANRQLPTPDSHAPQARRHAFWGVGFGVWEFRAERGMTLVEATVVLMISALLVAVAAPVTSRTLDRSRLTRAVTDTQAIRTAIDNLVTEFTAFTPFRFTSTGLSGGDKIEILVSDGDIPGINAGLAGSDTNWVLPTDCCANATDVAFLEAHLALNADLDNAGGGVYSTAATGWRGAYINAPVDPDPWGNRYAANVEFLEPSGTADDVFVLSAGPDEEIDTEYQFTTGGARPGDDDITNVIRRHTGNLEVP